MVCSLLRLLLVGVAVAVAAVSPVRAADNYVLGVCEISRPDSGAEIRPTFDGGNYLVSYHGDDPRYKGFSFDGDGVKVTLIEAPAHGKVALEDDSHAVAWGLYHYMTNEGYLGKDRFVMQVEKNGVKVKINYVIEAIDADTPTQIRDDGGVRALYCDPDIWNVIKGQ